MAPHGRPKLKRPPRADAPGLPKLAESQCTDIAPNAVTSEALNTSREKTPTPDSNSTPVSPAKSPTGKSPPEEDRGSPEPNCAICLGKLRNKSFTDSCLHQFCFKCLVQWSKVKPECPLCKQGFKSIIHNVRSNEDYDQYHCRPATSTRDSLINELLAFSPRFSSFRYRTTQVSGPRRMGFDETTIHELFLQHQNMYVIPPVTTRWSSSRTRRQVATAEFRTTVYNRDMWVQDQPDITGRYRECSPEFYSANQAQIHRLVPWLNREIPSVTQSNSTHAQVILDRILSLITQYHIQSQIMYGRLWPFFGARTRHFIHEFYAFARSPYDMIGFDQAAVYGPNPNPTIFMPDMENFSDSDNSDVIILDSDDLEPVAGPSGLRQHILSLSAAARAESSQTTSRNVVEEGPLLIEDSDDCEIVDYVKPRHERTPEFIILSETDEETRMNGMGSRMPVGSEPVAPSVDERPQSISESSSTESSSASEYAPYTLRSSKKSAAKKFRKKGSKISSTKYKSSSKSAKTRDQPIFSDSDDEDTGRKSSKCRRRKRSAPGGARRTSQRLPSSSPSGCENDRTDLPGPSSSRHRTDLPGPSSSRHRTDLPGPSSSRQSGLSSYGSLSGHSNSFLLDVDNKVSGIGIKDSSSMSMTQPLYPLHSSPTHFTYSSADIEYKPNVVGGCFASHSSHEASPLRYDREHSPQITSVTETDISSPALDTWCIKPSTSNHEESTDEDASSNSTSDSEYRPKLKSIVIMRTNNSNHHSPSSSESSSSDRKVFRRCSQSPIASTSRREFQSSSTSQSSRARSFSPVRYSLQSSALSSARGKILSVREKVLKHRHKFNCRESSTESDSDSSLEPTVKKRRTSKWQL